MSIYNRNNKNKKQRNTSYSKNPYIPYDREAEKQKRKQRNLRLKNRRIFILSFIFIVIISITILVLIKKNAYNVTINNQSIGVIKKTKVKSEDIINTVVASLENQIGSKVKLNDDIKFKAIKSPKKNMVTTDYIISKIKENVTYKVEASVITVNGEELAILSNGVEAENVLNTIKNEYIPNDKKDSIEAFFLEDVDIVSKYVDSSEIMQLDVAIAKFDKTTKITKTYTVLSGDTVSKIASNFNMTLEELFQENVGLTNNISIGQVLNVIVDKPLISVKTIETDIFTEIEKKNIEYRTNNSKPSSYQKVVQQGKDGQKEITIQTVRINGFEEEQKVISEKITQEPITEIIEIGTN